MQRFIYLFIYLFLKTLYTFQAVPPLIIRSTQLYRQLQVLSTIMIELNRLLINFYTRNRLEILETNKSRNVAYCWL